MSMNKNNELCFQLNKNILKLPHFCFAKKVKSKQKLIKNSKNGSFWRLFENLKLALLQSNSVTRQVTFNRTKMGRKFQNWKIKSATFWAIFKHCVLVFYIDKKESLIIVTLINEVAKEMRKSKNISPLLQIFWFLLFFYFSIDLS